VGAEAEAAVVPWGRWQLVAWVRQLLQALVVEPWPLQKEARAEREAEPQPEWEVVALPHAGGHLL